MKGIPQTSRHQVVCNDGHVVDSFYAHIRVYLALYYNHIENSDGTKHINYLSLRQHGCFKLHLLFGYFLVSLRLFRSSIHVHVAFFATV